MGQNISDKLKLPCLLLIITIRFTCGDKCGNFPNYLCLEHVLHEKRYTTLLEREYLSFSLTRISFKLSALLNPTIGILSKTFPYSLSGVNTKCISDSIFLSFVSTG